MASQALYLKWRPQRFEDVVGQEHVTTTLKNALRSGRISHAYLFSGPRGTGKTTMARLLAKAVNCLDENIENRPCNKCHICQSVNEGRLLDLIEMDAASHTGVDNVREAIRDKVGFRPNEARYKVYVIDEVHMLSTSAFNALLKTLEEPPEHVIFCLATTEPHKILPTILSRCQHFEFHRISQSALVARLGQIAEGEGLRVEPDALAFIAHMSTGCARDAISLLDQLTAYSDETVTAERVRAVLGLSDEQSIYELIGALARHDIGEGLDVIGRVVESGVDVRQFVQQVIERLRTVLLLRVGGGDDSDELDAQTRRALAEMADRLTTHGLVQAIKLFNQAQLDLRGSDQSQLALELAFVEAALPGVSAGPGRVEQTEPNRQGAFAHTGSALRESVSSGRPKESPAEEAMVATSSVPAAPPRTQSAPSSEDESAQGARRSSDAEDVVPIALAEMEQNWHQIRQAIRSQSRQVEALVNSSTVLGIEQGNCLVLEFASEFLSSKLGKEENRRIVEQSIGEVLGKRCRVRATFRGSEESGLVRGSTRIAVESRADDAEQSGHPVADIYQEAEDDPIVQDLVSRGGQVTDVQVLSDE